MPSLIDLRLGYDLRQSSSYANYMNRLGWTSYQIGRDSSVISLFTKKIGPFKIVKSRRAPINTPWESLLHFLKLNKILISQIDLESGIAPKSFYLKKDQILGTKTLLVDLRPKSEQILSSFKPETRLKLHRLYHHQPDFVLNDYDSFYQLLKTGLGQIGVWSPPYSQYTAFHESFGSSAFSLSVAGHSGCLVIINGPVAEYYYAASDPAGKSKNLPYWAVWLAMLEAKKRGALVWDFNGLIDPRWPDPRWAGFSFFKSRFGGTELTFPGTYIKYGWW